MDTMLLLKATAILSLTLVAARLTRRAAAGTRHWLWSVAFVSLLVLPLLAITLPVLHVPMPARWDATAEDDRVAVSSVDGHAFAEQPATVQGPPAAADYRPPDAATLHVDSWLDAPRFASGLRAGLPPGPLLLTILWLLGTMGALTALFVSLLRVRTLARTADELDDPEWRDAAKRIAARLGLRREPQLLVSRHVGSPMAGGVWRPVVFLPRSIDGWNAELREVVLAHEIAHLAGSDPLRHILARLAVALYWFHPLVWIAAWQASIAREQACDEAVLSLGTRPSIYARILLDLAEVMGPSARGTAALSMVERTLLETRLMKILSEDTRYAAKRRIMIPVVAVGVLTLPLAAMQPAPKALSADVAQAAAVAAVPASPAIAPISPISPVSTIATNPVAAPLAAAQTMPGREVACSWNGSNDSSMNGSERLIQQTIGDIQLCMVAIDAGERAGGERPSQWMQRARRVIIEARQPGAVQRLEIVRTSGAVDQVSWQTGASSRPFDAAAARWRDHVLAVLDTTWEISSIRGQVSAFRGEISAVHGRQSALQGEISALRGEVSAMRGTASAVRGEESAMRGQISAIRGRVSEMRGAISAEQGAISAVTASRHGATSTELAQITERVRRHEAEIASMEKKLRAYTVEAEAKVAEIQKTIDALGATSREGEIHARIAAFDLNGKVADVQRRIAELDVQGKVGRIERQIAEHDADRRIEQLRKRRDSEVKELEAAIAAIR